LSDNEVLDQYLQERFDDVKNVTIALMRPSDQGMDFALFNADCSL
jgi:hypothetical protein